jgi:hypothetical protein
VEYETPEMKFPKSPGIGQAKSRFTAKSRTTRFIALPIVLRANAISAIFQNTATP